jgi:hypothetical protein
LDRDGTEKRAPRPAGNFLLPEIEAMPPVKKPPINAAFPVIVVKRQFFEEFAAGRKNTEFRLHRKPFTNHVFYAGRWVRLAYRYDFQKHASLLAIVKRFEVRPAFECAEADKLRQLYPRLEREAEIALIHLDVQRMIKPPGSCYRDAAGGVCVLAPEDHCRARCPYAPAI